MRARLRSRAGVRAGSCLCVCSSFAVLAVPPRGRLSEVAKLEADIQNRAAQEVLKWRTELQAGYTAREEELAQAERRVKVRCGVVTQDVCDCRRRGGGMPVAEGLGCSCGFAACTGGGTGERRRAEEARDPPGSSDGAREAA